jgi:Fe(3+) dicitrate transport protein
MTTTRFPRWLLAGACLIPSLAAAEEAVELAAQTTGTVTEEQPVEMPVIEVIGTPDRRKKLPGSAQVLDRESLDLSHAMTTNEALRKAAGVNVRDEEGFGLRPNIGIRGLNPTRSTKVLLLEDGIPLSFAPYGDNASYYHPPVDRFDRIEILKGAGQNIYGPQTIGGVINYITPAPPAKFGGSVRLTGGNREYANAAGTIGGGNMMLDYVRKQGDGARDNVHSELNDVNYKGVMDLGSSQALTARANYYSEDSQVTYSGLTDAEYANFGAQYNPFKNDFFETDRQGVSFTHEIALGEAALLTNFYTSRFSRDWWRQASSTADSQCGATFTNNRTAGLAVDPDTCNSNVGNLREYFTYGLEPRLAIPHTLFGATNDLDVGVRVHFEEQDRIQRRGTTATARSGNLGESQERLNEAVSGFVQNRTAFGDFAIIPGVRVEHVQYERINRCPNASFAAPVAESACTAPVSGEAEVTEILPSLGLTFEPITNLVTFAGAHRGFAPPGVADLINSSGATVDLEAEESWNYELGLRAWPHSGLRLEATAFLNDFERQIAVGSIAAGGVPLATGETRYEGAELLARTDLGRIIDSAHNPFVEVAYTWLPTADQETAFRRVDNGTTVTGSAPGNRLPYAPEHLVTSSVGYGHAIGFDTRLELVYVGSQYADFANSTAANGTGQAGEISSYTIWNASMSYTVRMPGAHRLTFFTTGKNLFDKVYIADRTRGILPGAPRLVQAGVEYNF